MEACVALSRNTPLLRETEFYQKCTVNICCVLKNAIKMCVHFGHLGTLFYTEGAVLPLKKSSWSKLMHLSQRSYLKIVLETTSDKSSSSRWFQFSMLPEALVHSATQACLSGRFLLRHFTCTPPLLYARVCAHARVCAQLWAKSGKKGCPGSKEDAGYCNNTACPA